MFTLLLVSLFTFVFTEAPLYYPVFSTWVTNNNRTYTSVDEYNHRHYMYNLNLIKVLDHNSGNHTYWLDVNKFADLSSSEFAADYITGYKSPGVYDFKWTKSNSVLPTSVDWTSKGNVKYQGQCGSFWADSTENALFLKNGSLATLSNEDYSFKCGFMDYGFQYSIDNKSVAASLTGFNHVPANSEVALMTAISLQPVLVALEADKSVFQLYGGGVMNGECGTNLNHVVLAVGYGTLSGHDFYKVKNYWGTDWGEQGYILLGRGPKFGNTGQCGIQMNPSYPLV